MSPFLQETSTSFKSFISLWCAKYDVFSLFIITYFGCESTGVSGSLKVKVSPWKNIFGKLGSILCTAKKTLKMSFPNSGSGQDYLPIFLIACTHYDFLRSFSWSLDLNIISLKILYFMNITPKLVST